MMTIAELLDALNRARPSADVVFAFGGCVPTTVASSRGDYATPALGWSAAGYTGEGVAPTVGALVVELEEATDGREYPGWKGGEYRFTREQSICVDNPGDWTSTHLAWVEDQDWRVVLHTQMEE